MIDHGWQERLFEEGSFFKLYRASRKHVVVPSTLIVVLATLIVSALPILFGYWGAWRPIDSSALVIGIRVILTLGVAFATSILGFLVSGFALFFAITRSDIMILLAGVNKKGKEVSHLRFILFSFMYVFFHYLIYLAIVLGASVCFSTGSVLGGTSTYLKASYPNVFKYLLVFGFSISAAWLMFVLMLLKTFIWNLFQTVLISITLGADMDSGRLGPLLDALRVGSSPEHGGGGTDGKQ